MDLQYLVISKFEVRVQRLQQLIGVFFSVLALKNRLVDQFKMLKKERNKQTNKVL